MTGKFLNLMISFYFFNMIAFANGSMVSKIGKMVFVGITAIYVFRNNLYIKWKSYYYWMLIFLGFSCLSICWAYSKEYAVSGVKTIALNFLCIFMLTQLITRKDDWNFVIAKAVMVCPILRYLGLLIEHGTAILGGLRNVNNVNHNTAGMFAAWGVVFGVYYLIISKDKRIRWKVWICIDLLLLIVSMSRKAILYVGLPVIIVYLLMGKGISRKVKNYIVLFIGAVVAYLAIMNIPVLYKYIGNGIEKMLHFFSKGFGDISAAGRRTRIVFGMSQFVQRPWFGWGAMNYNLLFSSYQPSTDMVIADNNFVDVLVNFGIIGFCCYYLIYIKGIALYIKNKSKQAFEVIAPFAMLITLLISDYGVSSYIYIHSQTFITVAMCLLLENDKGNN